MSHLADILDAERTRLVERWTARAGAQGVPAPPGTGLRDHIPDLVGELTAALRAGAVPAGSATARAHGIQFYAPDRRRRHGPRDLDVEPSCRLHRDAAQRGRPRQVEGEDTTLPR